MHPITRITALVLGFASIFASQSWLLLGLFWLVILIFLQRSDLLQIHLRFLGFVVFPVFFALGLVWGFSKSPPQNIPFDWPWVEWIGYCLLISLRLATAGALLQLLLVPLIRSHKLAETLRYWGTSPQTTQYIVSTLVLLEDMKKKARQVMEARKARGLASHSMFNHLKNLPVLLRPMFFTSLISSLKRTELWEHRQIDPLAMSSVKSSSYSWCGPDYWILTAFLLVFSAAVASTLHVF